VFYFGRNTLLVPIFRGCFQFGPSDLKPFNWVPVFLSVINFTPEVNSVRNLPTWQMEIADINNYVI
jgi:hypothetical protein